jgi:hypothetical protein
MSHKSWMAWLWQPLTVASVAVLGIGLFQAVAAAQYDQPSQQSAGPNDRPVYQTASRSEMAKTGAAAPMLAPGRADEHPLMPVLRWAYAGLGDLDKVPDYSATLAKRERIGGKVMDYQYMFVKVRQHPFSVYLRFLGPADMKGQEVVYVEGKNKGSMLAHGVGLEGKFGTLPLKPDGAIAMRNQVYPLTELGILNLTKRLVEVGEHDAKFGECDVKFYEGAKIKDGHGGSRVCTCIEVVHPVPRQNFRFHLARIFVDKELNLPIRYESFDWPKTQGGRPELLEEYTYLNLKLNNGFSDADFDVKNPAYNFR